MWLKLASHTLTISYPILIKFSSNFLSILQDKPKKEGPMSLDEAVDDSENLTDFPMDFEEEE